MVKQRTPSSLRSTIFTFLGDMVVAWGGGCGCGEDAAPRPQAEGDDAAQGKDGKCRGHDCLCLVGPEEGEQLRGSAGGGLLGTG